MSLKKFISLEQQAIATAPIDCNPKLWKRYVDDILEIIKRGQLEVLTDHFNGIDKTNSIKFTHKPEKMAWSRFLTSLSPGRRTDSSNYWFTGKPHTQTSTCRFNRIIHFSTNLLSYGRYWKAIRKDINPRKKKHKKNQEGTVPYVHSFEKIHRIFTKHRVATVVKTQITLRQVLVHPKDKVEKQKKAGVVYKIQCTQCEKPYIGETGRQLGIRITEAEKISEKNFTRSTRRASTNEYHKSAITDHVCQNNHIMNWEASDTNSWAGRRQV